MYARFYVAYFPINPYGDAMPEKAMKAARAALDSRLGGACRVLAAKAAFEDAGGLQAYWQGIYPPAITHWTIATYQAVDAALQAEPPRQSSIEDIERLSVASIDVLAAAHYAYTPSQWLDVFTAHFGMSDHCDSHDEAKLAGSRWLAIAPGACPIAAADQEIRRRCAPTQPYEPARTDSLRTVKQRAHLASHDTKGAQPCF
jgi:hypothetical protein